jgi:hypothetical protein
LEVQHQGNSDLFGTLRKAAEQLRALTAQTVGMGAVMAGSYIAKKILETLPEPSSVHDAAPTARAPEAPAPADKPHSRAA